MLIIFVLCKYDLVHTTDACMFNIKLIHKQYSSTERISFVAFLFSSRQFENIYMICKHMLHSSVNYAPGLKNSNQKILFYTESPSYCLVDYLR